MTPEAAIPFLPCRDLQQSIDFYCRHLGFQPAWTWGTPVSSAAVQRGAAQIFLTQNAALAERIAGFEIMIRVADADTAYAEHAKAGLKFHTPIRYAPWRTREYAILDPSGIRIRIYTDLEPAPAA